jgi:hypothetical protein
MIDIAALSGMGPIWKPFRGWPGQGRYMSGSGEDRYAAEPTKRASGYTSWSPS